MSPNDKPRDDNGADFDLERLRARFEHRISQVRFDLPELEPPEALPERPAPPPLDPPPLPQKKSYFDDIFSPPKPPVPPRPELRPRLGIQEAENAPPPAAQPPQSNKPQPVPPSPGNGKKAALWSAAALLLLSGLLIWRGKSRQPPPLHVSFPLPLGRMTGLLAKGNSLLTIDTDKQALVAMSTEEGRILSREKFPNPSLRGFAWGQESFWSSDLESGFIYRHAPAEPHALINAFPTSRSVSVLHHDGQSLWAGDARSEIVYHYALSGKGPAEKLALQAQYALPGIAVGGFHRADDVLWVLDCLGRKVIRYRLASERLTRLDAADLSSWLAPASEIAGFAVEQGRLWLIADNPAALHRFELSRLSWEKSAP